jgi:hypothetical protein
LHRGKIEHDRAAQQRVQAFEWDRIDMSGMDGRERYKIWLDGSAEANAR